MSAPVDVELRGREDSPALIRAGTRWGLAAYLHKQSNDAWAGKVSWDPMLPEQAADAVVIRLASAAGLSVVAE